MFDLSGKKALVTGASSGLGAHFAQLLAASGAQVVLAARRIGVLQDLAAEIGRERAHVVRLDVSDFGAVRETIEAIGPLDILVNNAGAAHSAAAIDQSEADWDLVMNTNLKGMFAVAQAVARAMRDRDTGGSIVNVASILGLRQVGGVLPYAVSKAGVIQMTKSLALELARYRIRVNALAPGYISTDLNRDFFESPAGAEMLRRIPQRRAGNIADLDGPLMLLVSDASSFMTGSTLVVDGGHLLSAL